ncbi:MAG: OsmC family protein [Mailhella sp.]|nr:OsmC family protein [Mailhella sp.]
MQLSVKYHRDGDVHTIETGGAALGNIVIDNTNIPADQRGGTAKQLLASAAIFCYASALNAAMETRALKYQSLDVTAEMTVDANEKGQSRVQKIVITANVGIDEEDLDLFERVARVMKGGCLVTGSLHDGIEMEYKLNAVCEDD